MSYRRSRARREFQVQLDQAIVELSSLYRHSVKVGSGSGGRLLAAYFVFAFAQLEVYVKTLVEDAVGALVVSTPAFDKWPDPMLGYFLHKSVELGAFYHRFAITQDEGAIAEHVAATARRIAIWSAGGATPTAIEAAAFIDKKKYPSPKNLPQLFKRVGINQIWAVIGATGRINGELILTSLNDLRTDIAHEGKVPVGFTLRDFKDRMRQMSLFVAALDRGVSAHFCRGFVNRATWNASVG